VITEEDLHVGAIVHVPSDAALTQSKPFNLLLTDVPEFDEPRPDDRMVVGWVLRLDGTRATSRKHKRSAWIDLAQCTLVTPKGEPVWLVNGTHVPDTLPAWHALPPGTDSKAQPPRPGHRWSTTRPRTTAVCGLVDRYFAPSAAGQFGVLARCTICCRATGAADGAGPIRPVR
jgi:hypothetical protein